MNEEKKQDYKLIDVLGGFATAIGAEMIVSTILGPYTASYHGIKAIFAFLGEQGISGYVGTKVGSYTFDKIKDTRESVKRLFSIFGNSDKSANDDEIVEETDNDEPNEEEDAK